MNSSELRSLADHMGHDLNIHLNHYALQTNIIERTKVAKVLSAVSNGNWSRSANSKELDEVIIPDQDILCDDGEQFLFFAIGFGFNLHVPEVIFS